MGKAQGAFISKSYYELIHPNAEDERSGDEIAADFMARHSLNIAGKEDEI